MKKQSPLLSNILSSYLNLEQNVFDMSHKKCVLRNLPKMTSHIFDILPLLTHFYTFAVSKGRPYMTSHNFGQFLITNCPDCQAF